jgi:hypothetical protein
MAIMDVVRSSKMPALRNRLGWLLFVVLACGHFSIVWSWRSQPFLNLRTYANYGERLPYQGRVLMAWVLHVTAGNSRLVPWLVRLATPLPKELRDPYTFVLLITTFATMFIAILAARASLLALTGNRRFASWAALLTIYMAYFNLLAVYGLTYTLPYDVPALALFSLGVWLVLTKRYGWLLGISVVGSLNRETFCFVTMFFALYTWFETRQDKPLHEARPYWLRRIGPHVAMQAAVWIGLRLWLRHLFAYNPLESANGEFDFQLAKNVKSLLNPFQWPLYLSLFGFTLPLFFAGYRWIGDRALARSTAVLLALWLPAMMIVGIIVEIRVFNELTAFLVPSIALMGWNRWVLPATKAAPEPKG